jgi:hypothetical protein
MYANKGFINGVTAGLGGYSAVHYWIAGSFFWFGLSILILLLCTVLHYNNTKKEKVVRTIGSMYIMLAHKAAQFIGEKEHMDEFTTFLHKDGLTLKKVNLSEM